MKAKGPSFRPGKEVLDMVPKLLGFRVGLEQGEVDMVAIRTLVESEAASTVLVQDYGYH